MSQYVNISIVLVIALGSFTLLGNCQIRSVEMLILESPKRLKYFITLVQMKYLSKTFQAAQIDLEGKESIKYIIDKFGVI